jgi:hypothetical protein
MGDIAGMTMKYSLKIFILSTTISNGEIDVGVYRSELPQPTRGVCNTLRLKIERAWLKREAVIMKLECEYG